MKNPKFFQLLTLSADNRDGLGGGKSQIVRTPLRVKHDSVGKPEWIFFSLKSPIDFTVFSFRI